MPVFGKNSFCSPHSNRYEDVEELVLKEVKKMCKKCVDRKKFESILKNNNKKSKMLEEINKKMAVEAIANKACKKVSIKVSERVTINISGSADEISVERKFKEDNKLKANKW